MSNTNWIDAEEDEPFTEISVRVITPRVRGYVFVLVALASHEKLDLQYSY